MIGKQKWREIGRLAHELALVAYPDWDDAARADLAEEIQNVIEAAGEDDDPRSMGWVSDKGLP